MACHETCRTKLTAPQGLPRRPPTLVLTGPCDAQPRRSEEIRCIRCGTAINDYMLTWGRRDSERHASFQKDPCRFRRHCFGSEGSLQFGRTSPDLERPASFQKDPLRFRKTRFGFERLLPIQKEPLRFRKPSRARRQKRGASLGQQRGSLLGQIWIKGATVDPDYKKGGRCLDQKATKQAVIGPCVNLRRLLLARQQRRVCC